MIAQLSGKLTHKSVDHIIIDVGGVGYQVHIPLSTYYVLPECDADVKLFTYTHVREDALQIYGFLTPYEKEIFQHLISVSGIGPKLATNILSGISAEDLKDAIIKENMARLNTIPGVGRKTAERMIVELKEKLSRLHGSGEHTTGAYRVKDQLTEDVLSALVNLGYKRQIAENAVEKARAHTDINSSVEILLKAALRMLSK